MDQQRRSSPRLHNTYESSEIDHTPNVGGEQVLEDSSETDPTLKRRGSQRLQNIPVDKRPYYGDTPKRSLDSQKGKVFKKQTQTDIHKNEEANILDAQNSDSSKSSSPVKSAFTRVKETMRLYNKHYYQFLQKADTKRTGTNKKSRPDLQTLSEMQKSNEVLFTKKQIGDLPGVIVGHQFLSRAEMAALGFHAPLLSGIDFIRRAGKKLKQYHHYTFPFAVSVIVSGQYEDNVDKAEEIIYTGQGGNDHLGTKHQIKDQVLDRGNLALKNNIEQKIPVRVTRGYKCGLGRKKAYTYGGLYEVVDYWAARGVSGFVVFKFRLKRCEGQPKLTNDDKVSFVQKKLQDPSDREGVVCLDISNGLEKEPIPAINLFNPPVAPEGFTYVKSTQVADGVDIPPDVPGCNCKGNCKRSKSCSCAQLNGNDLPYVGTDGGRLIEPKDVVYECGPRCRCGPDCVNRTSQRKLKYRLEIYRTENKGWSVRSWDFIPAGAPVCEYAGILRKSNELDSVSENDYIFEIDCLQTMHGIGGREKRQGDASVPTSEHGHEAEFCIDAGSCGNVARFINHSCEPNLFVQCVLSSHHDVRLARVVLFAADNIPPLRELAYDYGYPLDSVIGSDGNIKTLPCHCGSAICRGRLY